MDIGIFRERAGDTRVALVPADAAPLVEAGHRVFFAPEAGAAAGFDDGAYRAVGARPIPTDEALLRACGVLLRVSPPDRETCAALRPDHLTAAFLNLGCDLTRVDRLRASRALALAYECVGTAGAHPIADACDAVTGRAAVDYGVELARQAGRDPRTLVVLGAGAAGLAAAAHAAHAGLATHLLAPDAHSAAHVAPHLGSVTVAPRTPPVLAAALATADVVIAAERATGGARAPTVLRRDDLATLRPGSVIVDAAADQGCNVETSRPTTRAYPTRVVLGIVHCAWPGLAARDPRAASVALSGALAPILAHIARLGFRRAAAAHAHIAAGLVVTDGVLAHEATARSFGLPSRTPASLLA